MKKLNKNTISSSLDYGLLFLVLLFCPLSLPPPPGTLESAYMLAPHVRGSSHVASGGVNFLSVKDR